MKNNKTSSILIKKISELDAVVSSYPLCADSYQIQLSNFNYFSTTTRLNIHNRFYNFPFLVESDGTPWYDGIRFVLHLVKTSMHSAECLSQAQRRKVSHLIDFKNWCNDEHVNMYDFSHRFAMKRPTYKYFSYLLTLNISAENVNQRTSTIFQFFEFHSSRLGIDMSRVDQVMDTFIAYKTSTGLEQVTKVRKRKLTATKKVKNFTKLNYVLDEGEELQPLKNQHCIQLYRALNSSGIRVDERLIFELSLSTGARKQTVLTLRLKHVNQFNPHNLHSDSCYRIQCGDGTDIDTKNGKRLTLVIHEQLAEKLRIYINSDEAKNRRKKFVKRFGNNIFQNPDDIYVFIGERGDCRYMSKTDPRHNYTYSRPNGRSISNVVVKLKKILPMDFPNSYIFHWNRATFALHLYQRLSTLHESNKISFDELIGFIQNALGHSDPQTTLKYLKLFRNEDQLLKMQMEWEHFLFPLNELTNGGNSYE